MKKTSLVFNLFFLNILVVAMDQELPVCLMLGYDRDALPMQFFPVFITTLWHTDRDSKIAFSTTVQDMQLITVDSRRSCASEKFKHIQAHPVECDFLTYSLNLKQIFIATPCIL